MKTEKRFTPKVLERFTRENRGTGAYDNYIPWHKVSRGDPASRGRSHIQRIGKRQVDLLSDGELLVRMFAAMIPSVLDLREQFPLSHNSSIHELTTYTTNAPIGVFPGTKEIGNKLAIKLPICSGDGSSCDWTLSTDLLFTFQHENTTPQMLAVSVKVDGALKERTHQLLKIEEEYWLSRLVPWVLIRKDECDHLILALLSNTRGWALSQPVSSELIDRAVEKSLDWEGKSLTYALYDLYEETQDFSISQNTFWQAVWSGKLTLDLRRGWRPHEPLRFLSKEAFRNLNPIIVNGPKWI